MTANAQRKWQQTNKENGSKRTKKMAANEQRKRQQTNKVLFFWGHLVPAVCCVTTAVLVAVGLLLCN